MSEQEKFLARWSRRKREGEVAKAAPPAKAGADHETERASEAPTPAHGADRRDAERPDEAFDISQLPSLDSISADTDIRDFLKPGVPASLSRAALRRAWSTDPAIRDFIGLSENSWDFNADEMQGFGPLEPSDNLRKLLAQATGAPEPVEHTPDATAKVPDSDETPANAASDAGAQQQESQQKIESNAPAAEAEPTATRHDSEMLQSHGTDAASQQNDFDQPPVRRRKSGGALPT